MWRIQLSKTSSLDWFAPTADGVFSDNVKKIKIVLCVQIMSHRKPFSTLTCFLFMYFCDSYLSLLICAAMCNHAVIKTCATLRYFGILGLFKSQVVLFNVGLSKSGSVGQSWKFARNVFPHCPAPHDAKKTCGSFRILRITITIKRHDIYDMYDILSESM